MTHDISIRRYCDLPARAEMVRAIDDIFFQSSNTQSFADEKTRAQFRERCLRRYLIHDPPCADMPLHADAPGEYEGWRRATAAERPSGA